MWILKLLGIIVTIAMLGIGVQCIMEGGQYLRHELRHRRLTRLYRL